MNERPAGSRKLEERLLGPTAEEVSCERCFDLLDEYVELDLGTGGADTIHPEMAAHLDGCPACREDFEALRDLVAEERMERR